MPLSSAFLMAVLLCWAPLMRAADNSTDLTPSFAALGSDTFSERKAAAELLATTGDPRLISFFEAYADGCAYLLDGRLVIIKEFIKAADGAESAIPTEPLTRAPIGTESIAKHRFYAIEVSRKERAFIRDAKILLAFFDPVASSRLTAVVKVGDSGDASGMKALAALKARETDSRVARAIVESIALIQLANLSPDAATERMAAIIQLGELGVSRALPRLQTMQSDAQLTPEMTHEVSLSITRITNWQTKVHAVGHVFSGLSLGSILVLMALGLSVVFGLMGVINMAHGEMMMLGAYGTFITQKSFEWLVDKHVFPTIANEFYFIFAFPVAFLVSAFFGWLIERLVIRHLYGRPLETLLATFGVSLLLIQLVRVTFGNNRAVNSPTWLQGGIELAPELVLPYSRLFIIAFCAACVLFMYVLTNRTKLGLLLRATTQNRSMAAMLGVRTRAIDGYTFALGSGIAGMAGCALTLISNITPEMGQDLVVDSFLVVVVGGVGKLAGVVISGLGLGCLTKIFEPWTQSVWAKVLVLLSVIVFIQWRPSGLFPQKGRMADV